MNMTPTRLLKCCFCLLLVVPAFAELPAPLILTATPELNSYFLSGFHNTTQVKLWGEGLGRGAMAPVDYLHEAVVDIRPQARQEYCSIYPNHVEKRYHLESGVIIDTTCFVSVDKPLTFLIYHLHNTGPSAASVEIALRVQHNLNYIRKFRRTRNDIGVVKESGIIEIHDAGQAQLITLLGASPTPNQVDLNGATAVLDATEVHSNTVLQRRLEPGAKELCVFVLMSGDELDTYIEHRRVFEEALENYDSEFSLLRERYIWLVENTARLITPDAELNQCFLWSKAWGWKSTRRLRYGPPYSTTALLNQPIEVLVASPDYHGVFANDCVQSIWGFGMLGPRSHPVFRNILDCLWYHHNVRIDGSISGYILEAVEQYRGNNAVVYQPLKIGQRPEWILGACSLIHWQGDDNVLRTYWARIRQIADGYQDFDDSDGDWLEDWSIRTFPEQEAKTTYPHEKFYASSWWVAAFREASIIATMCKDATRSKQYIENAARVSEAIDRLMSRDGLYAESLDSAHRQSPHVDHNLIKATSLRVLDATHAKAVFAEFMTSPELWTEYGPRRQKPSEGKAPAWGFMRWNLVHGLFNYGYVDDALELARRFAQQEGSGAMHFQAPESYPTATGATGKGYAWTAARMLRSFLSGLFGVQFTPEGFRLQPKLPQDWPSMRLEGLSIGGKSVNIEVVHGRTTSLTVNGVPATGDIVNLRTLNAGKVNVRCVVNSNWPNRVTQRKQ
jgi:hypothetical protein